MTESEVIEVDGINTFYGSSHVLFDVSLRVDEGETVALVGRNGAGKTTTLRSIMGLTPPREGEIYHRSQEIQTLEPNAIRRRGLSWVPEERRIFASLTVGENLHLAAGASDGQANLERTFERFPVLEERYSQPAGTLSGGEQQMLAIARGLLGPPTDLLMLDEPTEGLAPKIIDDVSDIIRELNDDGITILLVEQNAELALELADRAYIIDTGEIVHEDEGEALLADPDTLDSYLGVG